LFLFFQAFTLWMAWITEKAAETRWCSRIAELEAVNTQLGVELAAANAKVAEVKRREKALISDYGSLHNDFNDLEAAHAALGKEKENVEKTECKKAQWFRNLLHKKLAGLHLDMEKSVAVLGE
jgi:DNA repair exonuclease SbcCD ATPase subunit